MAFRDELKSNSSRGAQTIETDKDVVPSKEDVVPVALNPSVIIGAHLDLKGVQRVRGVSEGSADSLQSSV